MSGGLSVKVGGDIAGFQSAMTRAGDLAKRHALDIGNNFQTAAKTIDTAFSALENGRGLVALGNIPKIAKTAALAFVGFEAIKLVLNEAGKAAEAATKRLEELVAIGIKAKNLGVGTTFLQSLTGQAKALGTEAEKLASMLDKAREASTTRIGEGTNKATSAIEDRIRQNIAAGNLAQADLTRFGAADSQEARIRVVLDLLDQLRAKGAIVAALDIGGRMFGPEFEAKLRTGTDMIGAMRRALDGLAVGDQGRIIAPEEIQRAESMRVQLEEIAAKMETALVPLNRDIALWQAQQLQGWIDIKSRLAEVVVLAGNLYGVLQNVGAAIGRLGSAAPFKALRDFLDSAGMIDKGEVARLERVLNGGSTGDKPAVPKDADAGGTLAIRVRPKADTSRSLPSLSMPKAKSAGAATETDEIQRFIDQLNKSAAALKAESDNFAKSNSEKAIAIQLAKAAEIATAAGKTVTEAQTAAITKGASAISTYKDQLADLEQAQRQAADLAKTLGNALGDSFGDAILEGKSFSSILDDLTKQLARMAIRAAFTGEGPLAGLMGTAPAASAGSTAVGGLAGSLGKLLGFAEGGPIRGPGTGTSDSILARVSHGEFIVRADAAARHGTLLQAINSGRVPAFADGGIVGGAPLGGPLVGAPAAPGVVTIAPTINLTASGGTPAQNNDLAAQVGKQLTDSMRGLVAQELKAQLRPNGLLNR